ncbi:phosphate transporter family protein [Plectosphaerella plurivora]|uniref:Phosphate transporter n=1 Tax=Plectosphaerella plurivora TaxID=936078 RepID=A0A9P9A9Y5_9PEZI|nr:phosphate transporter family protein [Plectosphaerella plurivora]
MYLSCHASILRFWATTPTSTTHFDVDGPGLDLIIATRLLLPPLPPSIIMPAYPEYAWILAITTVALCASAFGNGANDVANAYATSIAARTLTMPQVGVLGMITEFIGAVALGDRVTSTIKSGIIDIDRFVDSPAVLMVVMGCAEVASAGWLLFATRTGFPVSTTQTIVGALIGAGIASVSQIAASWVISPLVSGAISALLFATLKFAILERKHPLERALRAIPFYLAFTCAVLAVFLMDASPSSTGIKDLGPWARAGIPIGTFFGVLLIAYVFFLPYIHRVVKKKDPRIRPWHIPLGPHLWRDDPWLYFPGKGESIVIDYYQAPANSEANQASLAEDLVGSGRVQQASGSGEKEADTAMGRSRSGTSITTTSSTTTTVNDIETGQSAPVPCRSCWLEPEERWLAPVRHLPVYHPRRQLNYLKYALLQGVSRDCVTHVSEELAAIHEKATRYDNRVEHLWTYAQVASAIMMSIAHGSNDVANAVGPWVACYEVYITGKVIDKVKTPVWILAIAGFLLGAGFWFMGHHIVKALGNKITQLSPTRGYAMELGAAITVLLASHIGLPVSTTQCLTGAVLGVALMNMNLGAVNWRQLVWIFGGWVLTLPAAGIFSGLLTAMALIAPQFTARSMAS